MDGRSNNFRRHQPPLTSRPQDQGRFNHQDARPESDQHNRQHARPASASHNQEFAQPTSSYHNRYDDESARNQGEALPRIATWEEYQSGRDQLEELEARAARSKNDPVQSRHWITQFMFVAYDFVFVSSLSY
ncbi:hypothetical protein M409DRAFT_52527 [Zasmidium cellare ATCC 36951]|uniref:Uncharacterized protein n=1 Tax=Zasmidium cellare ATCC 36951 TaxID=1080233 RepID=A0A6A6CRD9_ZASCE|nr:uncharacterized protein M409DRAFT_52527 [Zasmidium cellare ATCC 36951]KAF2169263.1 hypothetical protein M409DRAFT_52527 [Zasmidium cellare ATCC 36951]